MKIIQSTLYPNCRQVRQQTTISSIHSHGHYKQTLSTDYINEHGLVPF